MHMVMWVCCMFAHIILVMCMHIVHALVVMIPVYNMLLGFRGITMFGLDPGVQRGQSCLVWILLGFRGGRVGMGLLNNPPLPPLEEATKDSIMKAMQTMCNTYGGPRNYLQTLYSGDRERAEFASAIVQLLPMSEDVTYHLGGAMPVDNFNLHLAYFSFHNLASKKSPPGEALTMDLVDQYLTDGFRTIGDPIKVSRDCLTNDFVGSFNPTWATPGAPPDPLKAQSVMYVKGQARVLTALALVSLLIEDGVKPEKLLEATCQQKRGRQFPDNHAPLTALFPPVPLPSCPAYSGYCGRRCTWCSNLADGPSSYFLLLLLRAPPLDWQCKEGFLLLLRASPSSSSSPFYSSSSSSSS